MPHNSCKKKKPHTLSPEYMNKKKKITKDYSSMHPLSTQRPSSKNLFFSNDNTKAMYHYMSRI